MKRITMVATTNLKRKISFLDLPALPTVRASPIPLIASFTYKTPNYYI